MTILGELPIDVPPNGIAVTLATWPDGRDEVMAWEWPASVGDDLGTRIGDLLLRADGRLDPLRPDPDESLATGPLSPSPTADADAVLTLVGSLLPDASGVSLTDLLQGRGRDEHQPGAGPLDDRRVARVNDRSGVSVADAGVPELRVLSVGKLSQPVELAALSGHPGLRSLRADHGTILDLDIVAFFPSLEHLALAPEEWCRMLDSDLVPTTLVTAAVDTMGIHDPRPSISLANEILRRWDRPEIEVRTVIDPGRGPGDATTPPSPPPSRPGLLGRLGRRRRT